MLGLRLSVAGAVAMLAVTAVAERFCVIDLRGGPTAAAYPVAYRDSVPAGGWSDEFKTDFLVLKRVEGGKFLMGRGADMAPDREVTLTDTGESPPRWKWTRPRSTQLRNPQPSNRK